MVLAVAPTIFVATRLQNAGLAATQTVMQRQNVANTVRPASRTVHLEFAALSSGEIAPPKSRFSYPLTRRKKAFAGAQMISAAKAVRVVSVAAGLHPFRHAVARRLVGGL